LKETNGDIERAADWLFNHPDDQGIMDDDAPAEGAAPAAKEPAGSADLPASFQLKSIVCHKGTSIHAGYVFSWYQDRAYLLTGSRHYVAFIRKALGDANVPTWVLFNDEKVVEAHDVDEMRKFAYVYFFKRV